MPVCKHSHLYHFLQQLIVISPHPQRLHLIRGLSKGPFASTGNVGDVIVTVVNIYTFRTFGQLRPAGTML